MLISDTRIDARWPGWSRYVAGAGVHSVLGTRLYTSATTIGSLNLYDEEANHFSVEDQQVAHILARHAAVALDSRRTPPTSGEPSTRARPSARLRGS